MKGGTSGKIMFKGERGGSRFERIYNKSPMMSPESNLIDGSQERAWAERIVSSCFMEVMTLSGEGRSEK